jgi:transposase-like protein
MAAKKRKRYSDEQRTQILAAADREGLTANQVKKRFGVTPVTYYSWRKKSGSPGRRGRRPKSASGAVSSNGDLANTVRSAVAQKVRSLLPDIVRGEVNQYLDTLLGQGGKRRGRPPGRRRRRARKAK